MTEFIEKYSFGVKMYKVVEMKRRTKALSRDEYKIKSSECLVGEAHGVFIWSK